MTPESPQHWACGRTQLLSIKRARSEPHVFGFPTIFPSWRIPRTQSHGRTCLQHIQLEVQLQTTRCSHFPVSRSQLLVGRQLPAPAGSMRVGYSPGEMISCIPPPHLREVLKGAGAGEATMTTNSRNFLLPMLDRYPLPPTLLNPNRFKPQWASWCDIYELPLDTIGSVSQQNTFSFSETVLRGSQHPKLLGNLVFSTRNEQLLNLADNISKKAPLKNKQNHWAGEIF